MEKFKKTHAIRRDCDRKTVKQFLQDWRILQYLRREVLINLDFELLFPDKALSLYLSWDNVLEKIVELRGIKGSHSDSVVKGNFFDVRFPVTFTLLLLKK
ncbi:unnamed protein product [Acanthoscelides obtectus]|uniref:Uncharacterized protein n=1 Tax=Acanthoscelides obtectus TaxID=200917 RepID=A0A9P0PKL8_ACAOB|nr:unnamed protein product [Acanthoscelides obtectus]CAK1641505.1 hypothetical protein AOBTE_LOCUS12446 [Acanthoscelides obtectus]